MKNAKLNEKLGIIKKKKKKKFTIISPLDDLSILVLGYTCTPSKGTGISARYTSCGKDTKKHRNSLLAAWLFWTLLHMLFDEVG